MAEWVSDFLLGSLKERSHSEGFGVYGLWEDNIKIDTKEVCDMDWTCGLDRPSVVPSRHGNEPVFHKTQIISLLPERLRAFQ